MKHGIVALLFGLLGGALGALGVTYVGGGCADGAGNADGEGLHDSRTLTERMDRIEVLLENRGALTARLEGRPVAGAPGGDPASIEAGLTETVAKLVDERLEPAIDAAVERKWDELKAAEEDALSELGGQKRMALADVAREVGLSAGEEDDLRRIYADAEQKMLELMARPDGDTEQVRRDLEAFQTDEGQHPQLMAKYLPKMIGGMAELMTIEADKQTQVREAVGDEKASALSDYSIVEESPFDLNASMRVESGGRR